jgi:hypothetical protein
MSWLELDPKTALDVMSAVKTNKFTVDQRLTSRKRGLLRV